MRIILVVVFALGLINAFGQTLPNSTNEVSKLNKSLQEETSVIVAVTIGTGKHAPKTAYFLNDRFIKYTLLVSSNPELIDSLNIIYKPIEIDSVKYDRQIRLIAKNNYFPKAISLVNLKDKYFPGGLKNEPIIFTIDGNIVHGNYETYEIDENNLYAITLDSYNTEDKIKLQFLKLTTKSEANISNFKYGSIWRIEDGIMLAK